MSGLTRLAALSLAGATLAAPGAARAQGPRTDERGVIRAINLQRVANGLAPVRPSRSLAALARSHSASMVAHRRFGHGAFARRIARSSWARRHTNWTAGEALAWGTGVRATPDAIVAAWMQSPEHRRIVLDVRFHVVGVGAVKGVPVGGAQGRYGRTYTADFGS